MDISAQGALPHLDTLMKDFERYDVTQHALELDTYGFTVVPPEKLGVDDAFVERLRNALISTAERRHGVEIGDPSTAGIDDQYGCNRRIVSINPVNCYGIVAR